MELYKKIEDDVKTALKARDDTRLLVLRMLLSAVKSYEIDKKIARAQEGDILQILSRHIKQHKDSIEQFEKGNRQDLVEKERKELNILESYMPEQMTEAELEGVIKEAIATTGAATKRDMGKVMKAVSEKTKGRADGKLVNQLVMKMLP